MAITSQPLVAKQVVLAQKKKKKCDVQDRKMLCMRTRKKITGQQGPRQKKNESIRICEDDVFPVFSRPGA